MRILFFALIVLTTFQSTLAQKNIKVTWGPEYKLKGKSWISRVLGHDDEFFWALRVPKKGIDETFWIEKYSKKNMSQVFSKEIELPKVGRKTVDYEFLQMFNNEFLLITSYFDKKKDVKYAFAQTISKNGVLNSKFKEIDQVEGKRKNTTAMDFATSFDDTKLLVYRNEENEARENESFAYKAYDENLNELWNKSLEVEHSDRFLEIWDYKIDEKGIVYALMRVYPDRYKGEKKKGRKMQQYNYTLLIYNPENDQTKQFKVDLGPEKFISDISYTVKSDGELAIVGFYSKEDASSMDGTFFIIIDPNDLSITSKSLKAFDREFLLEFMKERHVNKDQELENFVFQEILHRPDGGFYIVAEQEYHYTTTSYDSEGKSRITHHYVANDLITINVDAEGNILWIKKIPKKQHTTNDNGEYLSFAMTWTDQQMHFIFNDDPKNEEQMLKNPDKMKTMTKPKKSVTTLVSMGAGGSTKRDVLFKSKDFGTILQPKLNYAPGNSELIIYGEKGSKYKFGRLSFSNFE